MKLDKQDRTINFSGGTETKVDPFQLQLGNFTYLINTLFNIEGLLDKRNGSREFAALPDTSSSYLTTFTKGPIAIGSDIQAYSIGSNRWFNQGSFTPLELETQSLVRSNTSQTQIDTTIADNGLVCVVYTDQNPANLSAKIYKYSILDSETGQVIVPPTEITAADATYGTPKVFLLGIYFVIVYTKLVTATYHLQYIAISSNNPASLALGASDISTSYTPSTTLAFDGAVLNNNLYIAWNGSSASGVKMAYIAPNLAVTATVNPDASHAATLMSVAADPVNDIVYASYYNSGSSTGYTLAVSPQLHTVLAATQIIASGTITNIASAATAGTLTVLYETSNNYSYDTIPTNFVTINTVSEAGVVGTPTVLKLGVGLASKMFYYDDTLYWLAAFQSPYQPTYFLMNGSGKVVAKLAYQNGGGYLITGLPSVTVSDDVASVGYLFKDLVQSVNKNTNVPTGTQVAGIYAQTGLNLASFTFGTDGTIAAEIGNDLNLTGGFLWSFDGSYATEQGFLLWPDSIKAVWADTGGAIVAKPDGSTNTNAYFYQVTYEWSDNQGNIFRSAPSIPVSVTTTGSGTAGTITVNVPTLRLSYKNNVKIVIYRWSVAQQSYYQVTSIATPTLNSTSVNSIAYVDTLADASILGNNLLYTTGGVVENIGGPAFKNIFIFDDRLIGITSENENLLWFSNQILDSTPVEMSDLLTYYVAPNIGAQGSTGPILCGAAMDDKAVLFKSSAINYFNGAGPDSTGNNSQYSQPIFITSTVGCSNQKSIIFQPQGLMFEFQSPAGNQIWLLGRDLQTRYIGASVQGFTENATVRSAINIPGTNQVRFTMSSGITLMFDYYYNKWSIWYGVSAISSTVYQGLQLYINSFGKVFYETPGVYLDGSSPVLIGLQTGWLNLAGLQGYQRAYYFFLLGTYLSPHKLQVQIAYDYNSIATQSYVYSPPNFNAAYGDGGDYGEGVYGGVSNIEQFRNNLKQQRCQSFQITINELYDASLGLPPGAGVTLSGINLVYGIKKGYPKLGASQSVG